MRHRKKKKIGKGMDHKRKLLRTLASSAILYEKIETSYANGRGVRPYLEKAVTMSKVNSLHTRRLLLTKLTLMAVKKSLEVLGPKYKDRKGGCTRILLLGARKGDATEVAMIKLVD